MASAHDTTLFLVEADEQDGADRTTQMIEWGKHISADDLEDIREERVRWRRSNEANTQQKAKMQLFARSLFLEDDDFEGIYKELQEWHEDVEKKRMKAIESKKMMEQAKKDALNKMELAMERKKDMDNASKKVEILKLPKPALDRFAPLAETAPPVAPAISFDPMASAQDPNCICVPPYVHPGRPCPEYLKRAQQNRPQQGRKRNAPGTSNEQRETKRGKFVPFGGDWKCCCCGYWNNKFWRTCRGKLSKDETSKPCTASRDDPDYKHTVQEEGEGTPCRKGGKYSGDWLCKNCDKWNSWHWKSCDRCNKLIDEVWEETDNSDNISLPPDKPYDGPRDDWGPDNQKTVDRTSFEKRSLRFVTSKKK